MLKTLILFILIAGTIASMRSFLFISKSEDFSPLMKWLKSVVESQAFLYRIFFYIVLLASCIIMSPVSFIFELKKFFKSISNGKN